MSSLQTKSGCSIPLGVEPCHSILSWLIRLVSTLPMKIVPRYRLAAQSETMITVMNRSGPGISVVGAGVG